MNSDIMHPITSLLEPLRLAVVGYWLTLEDWAKAFCAEHDARYIPSKRTIEAGQHTVRLFTEAEDLRGFDFDRVLIIARPLDSVEAVRHARLAAHRRRGSVYIAKLVGEHWTMEVLGWPPREIGGA